MSTVAEARAELARRELARRHLMDFVHYVFPVAYQENWHHRDFAEALEALARGERKRQMIFTPPRHGKSELLKHLAAWALGNNPDGEIMLGTYSAELAKKFVKDVRRIINSAAYRRLYPTIRIAGRSSGEGVDTALEFTISGHKGGLKGAGVGGGITGRGFNLGIIDDPFKSRAEAESETVRENVWDWYTSDFLTRQEGTAPIVVVHTRWHEDDLAGRLLSGDYGDPSVWDVVSYPALDEDGKALWAAKFSAEHLADVRQTIGERDWESLFQQNPIPPGGDIFKVEEWLRPCFAADTSTGPGVEYVNREGVRRQHPFSTMTRFVTADLASTEKTHGDFTVFAVWGGGAGGELFLLDVWRKRVEAPSILPALAALAARWQIPVLWLEKNGVGLPIVQFGQKARLPIRELEAHRDKVARAMAATPIMERGDFYVMQNAPWLATFKHELASFPNGVHDDQVDALSYGVQVWESTPRRSLLYGGEEREKRSALDGVQVRGPKW